MTSFTRITGKDIQILQDLPTYKAAWRVLDSIRNSCGVEVLLLCHLANYWRVEEKAIIARLTA